MPTHIKKSQKIVIPEDKKDPEAPSHSTEQQINDIIDLLNNALIPDVLAASSTRKIVLSFPLRATGNIALQIISDELKRLAIPHKSTQEEAKQLADDCPWIMIEPEPAKRLTLEAVQKIIAQISKKMHSAEVVSAKQNYTLAQNLALLITECESEINRLKLNQPNRKQEDTDKKVEYLSKLTDQLKAVQRTESHSKKIEALSNIRASLDNTLEKRRDHGGFGIIDFIMNILNSFNAFNTVKTKVLNEKINTFFQEKNHNLHASPKALNAEEESKESKKLFK